MQGVPGNYVRFVLRAIPLELGGGSVLTAAGSLLSVIFIHNGDMVRGKIRRE